MARRRRRSSTLRRAARTTKRTARFTRRHPVVLAMAAATGGAWYTTGRWLDLEDLTRFYVALSAAAIVLIVKLLLGIGYGATYVVETYLHEDMWLPAGQRRIEVGYVGKTTQNPPGRRIDQHINGSTRFGTPAKPWSDLATNWYLRTEGGLVTVFGLHFRELWGIRRLHPTYNHTMNLSNPRKVAKWDQIAERAQRDAARMAGAIR